MIRRIAHKTKPSRCRFIVNLCSELRFKSLTLPAATLLPGLLTTGGAPKHRAECAKPRLSPKNVGKRDLVGACRPSAPWPKCCDSSSVSLMRRKKTTPYSRNTKRFSEKQLDRATRQETVMPDRNNTNQVQRRRFPPEPRHSPCQYGWVLAAATFTPTENHRFSLGDPGVAQPKIGWRGTARTSEQEIFG